MGKLQCAGRVWATICFHVAHELGRELTFIEGGKPNKKRGPSSFLSVPNTARWEHNCSGSLKKALPASTLPRQSWVGLGETLSGPRTLTYGPFTGEIHQPPAPRVVITGKSGFCGCCCFKRTTPAAGWRTVGGPLCGSSLTGTMYGGAMS